MAFALAAGLWGLPAHAPAQPAEVQAVLPGARMAGSGRLTVWGLEVYDASLWVADGFARADLSRGSFALELRYLRAFTSADIAQRSIEEMRRAASFTDAQAAQWRQQLQASFPDVKKGDRIAGVHRPGMGALFLTNGRQTGEIRDAEFARLFFGIWLGAQTSEPALRQALLAQAP